MKINIKAILLASLMIVGLTGCSGSDSKDGTCSSNNQTAYINIWNEFRTAYNLKYVPEGKAYKEFIHDEEFDYLPEYNKLCMLSTLYLNDGNFTQFYDNKLIEKCYYSGDYKFENNGELSLDYQYNFRHNTNEEDDSGTYYDLKTGDTNMEEDPLIGIQKTLEQANEYGYVLKNPKLFGGGRGISIYMYPPYYYNAFTESYVKNYDNSSEDLRIKLYAKEDFLVTEQKGYSFYGDVDNKEFSLKFDNADIPERDEKDIDREMMINFNSDNTWDCDLDGSTGRWKLFYDNLLVIYSPQMADENDDMDFDFSSLLYLDFKNEEIYIPVYIRCDDMIDVAEEYKKSLD